MTFRAHNLAPSLPSWMIRGSALRRAGYGRQTPYDREAAPRRNGSGYADGGASGGSHYVGAGYAAAYGGGSTYTGSHYAGSNYAGSTYAGSTYGGGEGAGGGGYSSGYGAAPGQGYAGGGGSHYSGGHGGGHGGHHHGERSRGRGQGVRSRAKITPVLSLLGEAESALMAQLQGLLLAPYSSRAQDPVSLSAVVESLERDYQTLSSETVLKLLVVALVQLPTRVFVTVRIVRELASRNAAFAGELAALLNTTLVACLEARDWVTLKAVFQAVALMAHAKVLDAAFVQTLIQRLLHVAGGAEGATDPAFLAAREAVAGVLLQSLPFIWGLFDAAYHAELTGYFDVVCGPDEAAELMNRACANVRDLDAATALLPAPQRINVSFWNAAKPLLQPADGDVDASTETPDTSADDAARGSPSARIEGLYYTQLDFLRKECASAAPATVAPATWPAIDGRALKYTPTSLLWIMTDAMNAASPERRLHHLASETTWERHLLRQLAVDIIRFTPQNHTMCADILFSLSTEFGTVAGAEHFVQAAVEALIAEILRLPVSDRQTVAYMTLLSDMCKKSMQTIPAIMGRSIRQLWHHMAMADGRGGVDVLTVLALSDWFSLHLSNFGFTWKWDAWSTVLAQPDQSPQAVMVRETLRRMARLSYYDRIKSTLPPAFVDRFLPHAPVSSFAYGQPWDAPCIRFASTTLDVMRAFPDAFARRATVEEIETLVGDLRTSLANVAFPLTAPECLPDACPALANESIDALCQDVVLQALLDTSVKSFSHVLNAIERYLPLLRRMGGGASSADADPDRARRFLETLATYFRFRSQFLEIWLDKCINYRVLPSSAVIDFACAPQRMAQHAGDPLYYRILSNALRKCNLRILQIQKRLKTVRADAQAAADADAKAAQANAAAAADGAAAAADGATTDTAAMMVDAAAPARTPEMDALERALSAAQREQREAFVATARHFVSLVTAMVPAGSDLTAPTLGAALATAAPEAATPEAVLALRWVLGYWRGVGFTYREQFGGLRETLAGVVFGETAPLPGFVRTTYRELDLVWRTCQNTESHRYLFYQQL
ncbi:hypothetical protein CXG81DRAFT_20331 [Caulochytrium protostelioides]|uniref:MIF4G domain-containing protein n=1 Tax=Caulochytrium protostelioides TaxID=1555241 RepID=A0A4P9X3I9_9FUNG|nr:hypothetical protein CXG81DRAFT_20331 [Caulochytrium protostelioides]|eukprot:RKO99599.1 hypothetical protein CXG81DRAFT_20331 [Caulochytrium protostelioides]